MALTNQERASLMIFLAHARSVVLKMRDLTKYPELYALYDKILDNINHVPINIRSGETLEQGPSGIVSGMNRKKLEAGILRSAIFIPHDHLFEYGKVSTDGALTLLHELSHVVLPHSAHNFTAKMGLHPRFADEFFADLLMAHVAKNMNFQRESIGNHLIKRRGTFEGFPIDRFALEGRRGVAEEIREGRFRPRAIRRPVEEPIRAPERPVSILPTGRRWVNELPGVKKPRRFSPRFA